MAQEEWLKSSKFAQTAGSLFARKDKISKKNRDKAIALAALEALWTEGGKVLKNTKAEAIDTLTTNWDRIVAKLNSEFSAASPDRDRVQQYKRKGEAYLNDEVTKMLDSSSEFHDNNLKWSNLTEYHPETQAYMRAIRDKEKNNLKQELEILSLPENRVIHAKTKEEYNDPAYEAWRSELNSVKGDPTLKSRINWLFNKFFRTTVDKDGKIISTNPHKVALQKQYAFKKELVDKQNRDMKESESILEKYRESDEGYGEYKKKLSPKEGPIYGTLITQPTNDELHSITNRVKKVVYSWEIKNNIVDNLKLNTPFKEMLDNRIEVDPLFFIPELRIKNKPVTNKNLVDNDMLKVFLTGVSNTLSEDMEKGKTIEDNEGKINHTINSLNKHKKSNGPLSLSKAWTNMLESMNTKTLYTYDAASQTFNKTQSDFNRDLALNVEMIHKINEANGIAPLSDEQVIIQVLKRWASPSEMRFIHVGNDIVYRRSQENKVYRLLNNGNLSSQIAEEQHQASTAVNGASTNGEGTPVDLSTLTKEQKSWEVVTKNISEWVDNDLRIADIIAEFPDRLPEIKNIILKNAENTDKTRMISLFPDVITYNIGDELPNNGKLHSVKYIIEDRGRPRGGTAKVGQPLSEQQKEDNRYITLVRDLDKQMPKLIDLNDKDIFGSSPRSLFKTQLAKIGAKEKLTSYQPFTNWLNKTQKEGLLSKRLSPEDRLNAQEEYAQYLHNEYSNIEGVNQDWLDNMFSKNGIEIITDAPEEIIVEDDSLLNASIPELPTDNLFDLAKSLGVDPTGKTDEELVSELTPIWKEVNTPAL